MRRPATFLSLCCLLLFSGTLAAAQTTQPALSDRLLHKTFYLHGFWRADDLHYAADGSLANTSPATSFTLAGMLINKVELKGNRLELEGQRMATIWQGSNLKHQTPVFDPLKGEKRLRLTIDALPGGDFGPALDRIFAPSLVELAPEVPFIWQHYFSENITHTAGQSADKAEKLPTPKPNGNLQPPKVLSTQEPRFTKEARMKAYSGLVLVYLQVGVDGEPGHVEIVRPAGLGLDEMAAESVSHYRFAPAIEDGKPVRIELHVEVNFQSMR